MPSAPRVFVPLVALALVAAGCGTGTPHTSPAIRQNYAHAWKWVSELQETYLQQTKAGMGAYFDDAPAAPSQAVRALLGTKPRPRQVDLRAKCPPVYHQGPFQSCTAFAVAKGLGEFLLRRKGDRTPLSATHFWAATATAEQVAQTAEGAMPMSMGGGGLIDDEGMLISAAVATLELGGAIAERDGGAYPAEADWDGYLARRAARTPHDAMLGFHQAFGANFRFKGFTTRPDGVTDYLGATTRLRIKLAKRLPTLPAVLGAVAGGLPVVCGLDVHESFYAPAVKQTGLVPLPGPGDRKVGGHAMLIVGYDDAAGMLLVRNSWGPAWGEQGHARIPYQAVERRILHDFWTVAEE